MKKNYTIAVCGKGGTGKTTLSALVIRHLMNKYPDSSILAVDADPNANLGDNLGIKAENSIVAIVDDIAKNPAKIPPGMTKERYLEYQLQEALVEGERFDLLVMGRPEGPGCYCYVNNLLRGLMEKLSQSYDYLVIDNEAGMEHLSRRTTRKMDLLLLVSDWTAVGLRSAKRILDLTRELNLEVRKAVLALNRAPANISRDRACPCPLQEEIDKIGLPLAAVLPEDEQIARLSVQGKGIISLPEQSAIVQAAAKLTSSVEREM